MYNEDTRVKRYNNKKKSNFDGMGIILVIILIVGTIGVMSYKAHKSNVSLQQQEKQEQQAEKPDPNLISIKVHTYPNAVILKDGNEAGHTDKKGNYSFDQLSSGTKIQARYGVNKSKVLSVQQPDRNRTVTLQYAVLDNYGQQKNLNALYQSLTNLANHNNQISQNKSLEDFYLNGNHNSTYQGLFKWSKHQYDNIQKGKSQQDQANNSEDNQTDDNNDNGDIPNHADDEPNNKNRVQVKPSGDAKITKSNKQFRLDMTNFSNNNENPLQVVNFTVKLNRSSLNKNGSINLDYTVKNDYAYSSKDKIEIFNWKATLQKVKGQWKIVKATPSLVPKKQYQS